MGKCANKTHLVVLTGAAKAFGGDLRHDGPGVILLGSHTKWLFLENGGKVGSFGQLPKYPFAYLGKCVNG